MRIAGGLTIRALVIALVLTGASRVHAQETAAMPAAQLYGFIGGGMGFAPVGAGTVERIHLGAGADVHLWRQLAFQPELGWMSQPTVGCCSFGMMSANVSYHFIAAQRRLVPFATGGYALAFNWGTGANMFNLGGGVNYWASERWAWRFEFRSYISPSSALGAPRFVELRAGIAF